MKKAKTIQVQEKIDQLNQQAWDIRVNDSPKAFVLSRQSLKLARTINYKKGIAEATRSMGFCYVRLSKNDEALPVLNESLSLFEELNDLKGQAVVFEYLAVIRRNRGDLGAALGLFFKAVTMSHQTGASESEAIHHYQLGVTYKYLGNFDKALDSLFKSIAIHKENKNRFYQSYPLNVIGSIYSETGDHKKALDYYKEGLKLRQEFKDKLGEAGSLDNIGYTLFKLKKYTQALRHCEQSLAISKKTGDKRSQASALQHLAEIHAQAGDTKKAIASSSASRKIRKVTGDKRGEAEILLFQSGLPEQDPQKIVDWTKEALQIAKETKSTDIQSKAHHCLYEFYKQAGKFKEANAQLEKHFKLEKELQKNSVKQKVANLEIARKAEDAKKEAAEVMQRNTELSRLNKELEIEASLERVRAVAMGMNKPDDILDICKNMFEELQRLGFSEMRNTLINFWDDSSSSLTDYDYSDYAGGNKAELGYSSHPVFEQFQKKIRKTKDAFAELVVEKDQLKSWKQRRRDSGEYEDPRLNDINALYYYFYSIGVGAIGISTFSSLTAEKLGLLKRFRNVFELAYRRYHDIAKAEAQSREAQVELALERVRARTMAMQHSEELAETVTVLFEQFKALGEEPERMAIEIVNEKDNVFEIWATKHGGSQLDLLLKVSIDEPHVMQKMYKAWKKQVRSITIDLQGTALEEYFQFLKKAGLPVNKKIFGKRRVQNVATFSKGILTIITAEPRPAETIQLLERFANVFDGTYTRFLDLQKAEAQSREAQIELGLERVRARAMAMQDSDELKELIGTVFAELTKLDLVLTRCVIMIHDGQENTSRWWMANSEDPNNPVSFFIKQHEHPPMVAYFKVWRERKLKHTYLLQGKIKQDWDEFLFNETELKNLPDFVIEGMKAPGLVYLNASFNNFGSLTLASLEPLSDEHFDILLRFAKVFDLTYTRFNDLKQAEAQTRESQIQLAMERVRARTMAMQNSNEIPDAANLLFQQVQSLGMPAWSAGYCIWNEDRSAITAWMSSEGVLQPPFTAPTTEDELFIQMRKGLEAGNSFHVVEMGGKKLVAHYQYMRTLPVVGEILDSIIEAGHPLPTFQIMHHAYFSRGFLLFITYEPVPEAHDIFQRFGKVFDQTYTRFLDLQKAEAQAREAKIEAALERVRSMSMAMHQSSDLQEVIRVVTDQLTGLGVTFASANFVKVQPDGSWEMWLSTPQQSFLGLIHVPYLDHRMFNGLRETATDGIEFYTDIYEGEEKNTFFHHFLENTSAKNSPEDRKQFIYNAKGFSRSVFLLKNIWLSFNQFETVPFSEENNALFRRFATVFEQAYTRFLDLQKAEAQARESQIEAALERIRSRSMAMHNSSELKEVITVLMGQFKLLGFDIDSANFNYYAKTKEWSMWLATPDFTYPEIIQWPYLKHPIFDNALKALMEGKQIMTDVLTREEKDIAINHFYDTTVVGQYDKNDRKTYLLNGKGFARSVVFTKHIALTIANINAIPYTDEQNAILKRFATVFEQTYTRFLDLQKAEAQVREAKIEAALERTRTQSMLMQHSKELDDTLRVFHEQVLLLGIHSAFSFLWLPDEKNDRHIFWAAWGEDRDGSTIFKSKAINYPLDRNEPATAQCLIDWKSNEPVYSYHVPPAGVGNYFATWQELIDGAENLEPAYFSGGLYYVEAFMKFGCFGVMVVNDLTEDEKKILGRFAIEFERTYTRFLDLQKAEAQAKEAQIEAALEKVRSRSLAMHKSDELQEVVTTVFDRLNELGIQMDAINLDVFKENKKDAYLWTAVPGQPYSKEFHIPYTDAVIFKDIYDGMTSGKGIHSKVYSKEEKNDFLEHIFAHSDFKYIPQDRKDILYAMEGSTVAVAYATNTAIIGQRYAIRPFTDEETDVLKRFANVFEQCYTRFKDLEKAEAQSRESQIEAALERVRSKAMAMHKSHDLQDAVASVFEELDKLNLGVLRVGISVLNKEKRCGNVWLTSTDEGRAVQVSGDESFDIHPLLHGAFEAWLRQEDFSYILEGDDLTQYYKAVRNEQFGLPESQMLSSETGFKRQYSFVAVYNSGGLFAFRETEFPDEAKKVMRRFAGVFDLTYKRFLDLQKAEANAREATIEAAMERVRGKAMAMHNSNDLSDTASMIFTELKKLGIRPIRCGVGLLNKESRKGQLYSATSAGDGDSLALLGWVELSGHPVLNNIYNSWIKSEDYFPELEGEQLKSYYELLLKGLKLKIPDWRSGQKQYGTFLPFTVGCLYAWSETPYSIAEIKILKRFASIIDLTFRRYIELQKSEVSAKEAVKQSSLDRVRAEIASMRTVADLEKITPLIWNELTILGVPFIRCGVFIMDEGQQLIHTFLSTPDGKAIGAFHLPYTTPGNIQEVLNNWREKKDYIDLWNKDEFLEFADILMKQGTINSPDQYLSSIPQEGFYLHFFPFLQGMLYVGNSVQLGEDEIKIIQSLADAFSTAYARYEDFNKLEAAKQQVDKTLVDLKQTQQQLVQSEKMASLGELTAGIAHEIQNPLNFVNNFSEVSNELLDEMVEEVKKGNYEEVQALVNDVKQNLEKINHHGKRADGIVKGMLQHSRSSSANKESTDINKLADEYLRLAYHGLRAKDKSFNATMKTDYDGSVGMVSVFPQDIGRVILNLITNAFYVVNEKKKKEGKHFEPTVSVSTKKEGDKVEVRVRDNGSGIPAHVLDKIFQPFFTTKPTGQGTGLGLSLSYDIVKAHGGELKVETKEGEGTIFIIQLPLN